MLLLCLLGYLDDIFFTSATYDIMCKSIILTDISVLTDVMLDGALEDVPIMRP